MAVFNSDIVAHRWALAEGARCANPAALAVALREARQRTLHMLSAFEAALGPGLRVPMLGEFNLPLWEWGHIAWFSDWWIARNPERTRGTEANPEAIRTPPRQPNADALYNSSEVAHAMRWSLDLPDAKAVRAELNANLDTTLALLAGATNNDTSLYFFRLALFHEDMHSEAAVYMAQALGIDPFSHGAQPFTAPAMQECTPLELGSTVWKLGRSGRGPGSGFAFDNELCAHEVLVKVLRIDSTPVTWARYLPFIESGASQHRDHWSDAGWACRSQGGHNALPRYLRQTGTGGWEAQRFGQWKALDLHQSACHLTAFEAEAWCHWADRRLPTEAEWEAAACTLPDFRWGSVWEWTSSVFAPFPGFAAHPYRDYSQPWFDGRPVLKGASHATVPRMHHPQYRNFFTAERNGIISGFRSVEKTQGV